MAFADYVIKAESMPILLSETGYGSQYESPWIPPLAAMLFLLSFVVFIRQAAYLEGVSLARPAEYIRALLKPRDSEARKARNFAIVVLFEFINTVTITLHMSVRFIITGPGKEKIVQDIAYINENYRCDISREGGWPPRCL